MDEAQKEHIAKIAAARGRVAASTDDGDIDEVVQDNHSALEDALDIISQRIYSEPTHFLLELLQNADDNQYADGIQPYFSISMLNGCIRCDSNEVGFNAKNVSALCSINRSTKRVPGKKKHIGEKGLGFKSVFKIADVVWIKSGGYQFKLDKNHDLGMINPIWENFPADHKNESATQILLRLDRTKKFPTNIEKELRLLEKTLLLFLRRLQTVEVIIPNLLFEKGTKILKRTEETRCGGFSIRLADNSQDEKDIENHLIVRQELENMLREKQRPGMDTSEVVLSFPVDDNNNPICKPRHTYAFLPIRKYGFKFLIHGDFILTASRKDIENSCAWNEKIKDGIVKAFLSSVGRWTGSLRYTWPRFLLGGDNVEPGYFSELYALIVDELKSHEILESYEGELKLPSSLIFPPPIACDAQHRPLIPCDDDRRYLHPSYDFSEVKHLGIDVLSVQDFLRFLVSLVRKDSKAFQNRPPSWHSSVAKLMCTCPDSIEEEVLKQDIIPLRSGLWIAPNAGDIYFGETKDGKAIPNGLNIDLIDSVAAADESRSKLFKLLGCKTLNANDVCDRILARHKEYVKEKMVNCCDADLFEQAKFLFENTGIFFAEEKLKKLIVPCTLLHGGPKILYKQISHVYLPGPCGISFSKYFTTSFYNIYLLDSTWLNAYPAGTKNSKWLDWLLETVEISTKPALWQGTQTIRLAPKIQLLLEEAPNKLAELLKDHWNDYKSGIAYLKKDEPTLFQELCDMQLECLDGDRRPLNQCYVATEILLRSAKNAAILPFADLESPSDENWRNLTILGLRCHADVDFCIQCLYGHKKLLKPSEEHIMLLYRDIQSVSSLTSKHKSMRSRFAKEKLIAFPLTNLRSGSDSTPLGWYTSQEVVWEGPRCLKHIPVLSFDVPELAALFRDQLTIQNATIDTFVQEAATVAANDEQKDHENMKPILLQINRSITSQNARTAMEAFHKVGTFVVDMPIGDESADARAPKSYRSLLDNWFIADNETMVLAFKGQVQTWAVKPEHLNCYESLLTHLDLQNRKLSRCFKSDIWPVGATNKDTRLTNFIKRKIPSVLRLVPADQFSNALRVLKTLDILVCDRISNKRYIMQGRQRIYARESDDEIAHSWSSFSNSLQIYVPAEDARHVLSVSWLRIADILSDRFKITRPYERELMRSVMNAPATRKVQVLLDEKAVRVLTEEECAQIYDLSLHTLADPVEEEAAAHAEGAAALAHLAEAAAASEKASKETSSSNAGNSTGSSLERTSLSPSQHGHDDPATPPRTPNVPKVKVHTEDEPNQKSPAPRQSTNPQPVPPQQSLLPSTPKASPRQPRSRSSSSNGLPPVFSPIFGSPITSSVSSGRLATVLTPATSPTPAGSSSPRSVRSRSRSPFSGTATPKMPLSASASGPPDVSPAPEASQPALGEPVSFDWPKLASNSVFSFTSQSPSQAANTGIKQEGTMKSFKGAAPEIRAVSPLFGSSTAAFTSSVEAKPMGSDSTSTGSSTKASAGGKE